MTAGLKPWQNVMQPGVLYRAYAKRYTAPRFADSSDAQLAPTIESTGGDPVNAYASQLQPSAPPAGMEIGFADLAGIGLIDIVPNFLYVEPGDTPPDSIVISGVAVTALMLASAKNQAIVYVKANLTLIPPQTLTAKNQATVYTKANLVLS